jgi:hypothetical protein
MKQNTFIHRRVAGSGGGTTERRDTAALCCAGMKIFVAAVCALAGLTACEQQQRSSEAVPPPDAPVLTEPGTGKPESTPPPAPVKAEPAPTVEPAPPPAKPTVGSTVWAITRISVTTNDGIIGVPAGTRLRVVRENEAGYVVTDEKQEFAVTSAQVSLNGNAASSAAMADAAARVANLAWQKSQSAAGAKNNRAALANQALAEMQNRHERLTREEANLEASLARARAEDAQAYTSANQRRYFARTITPQQVQAWTARLYTVQAEKNKVYWELKRAQQ